MLPRQLQNQMLFRCDVVASVPDDKMTCCLQSKQDVVFSQLKTDHIAPATRDIYAHLAVLVPSG